MPASRTDIRTDPLHDTEHTVLPLVLAGPLLRRVQAQRVAWWLATTQACDLRITLCHEDGHRTTHEPTVRTLRAGERLFLLLIDLSLDEALGENTWTG